MGWRHIMITKKSQLSVRYNQLVITQEDKVSIPLEDIASILIEDNSVTITAYTLSKFSDYNIGLVTCNEKHLPNGILTSFQKHTRHAKVLQTQYNLSKPFRKRIWQKIIMSKIMNQAKCLEILEKDGYKEISSICKTIESGDATNREAYAAQLYFKYLFGTKFTRRTENTYNHSLNYGYSIIRGMVARTLVNYGFTPSLGIKHHNELNNFNLADDFMEVLRPIVDLFVATHIDCFTEFNIEIRKDLYNILNYEIQIECKHYSIQQAIEVMVKSYVSACRTENYRSIKLPNLIKLRMHSYE
ncbi:type II CRISPR-associated endonuclease Cas1 [Bacillus thuringiensis]|uniref:CRISPR-associated endonuclease Cas1 n=1 Tax=Bacillus thuringiensis TaxID=1428 RepID=A0AAW9GKU2_BACTU|nr:type II CRISPR-associated endonuclease Cas1 [Bacillus thuringiensis]MDY0855077.1 type II CRISPR-associated endonuclease Cas1 [Bacillus thuringiensis]MDY4395156.1 type II CRISPR-associated endonuclease Cas1 [Bacillus thuringiensis]